MPWAAVLWRACWQGALVLLLVWGICRVWPAIPAGMQCWLWRLAWAKLLLALLWAGAVPLAILPEHRPAPGMHPVVTYYSPPSHAKTSAMYHPTPANESETIHAAEGRAAPHDRLPSLQPCAWLLLLWLAGIGWSLLRLARAWRQVRRLRSGACPLQDEKVLQTLRELCVIFRLRGVPALATGQVSTPLLLGIRRPMIILPENALTLDANRLRLMLAHELAHLYRADLRWAWLSTLVEVLFFFHPVLWLTRREARLAQEMACDALVVETVRQPAAEYGATLLAILAQQSGRRPAWLTAGISEAGMNMQRRLRALDRRVVSRRATFAIALTMLLPALLLFIPWRLTARGMAATAASISYPRSHSH